MKTLLNKIATSNKSQSIACIDQTVCVNNGQSIITNLETSIVYNKPIHDKPGIYNPLGILQPYRLDEFPEDIKDEFEPIGLLTSEVLLNMASMLKYVAKDLMRPTLNAIYFDEVNMVATDANMLQSIPHGCKITPFMFPREAIIFLMPLFKKVKSSWEVSESNKYFMLENDDFSLYVRKIEGNYPNYKGVIPSYEKYKTKVTIPTKAIINDIAEAKKVNIPIYGVGIDYDKQIAFLKNVDFDYYKEYPIQVELGEIKTIDTLIMPMLVDKDEDVFGIGIINLKRMPRDTFFVNMERKDNAYLSGCDDNSNTKPLRKDKPITKTIESKPKTQNKMESNTPNVEVTNKQNKLRLVKYSEKAYALFGETKPLRNQLKEIGGKFNPYLKENGEKSPGWIFSAKKLEQLTELVNS
jgi:hypothetical protein